MTKKTAKRRLTEIDFSAEGSHIALCAPALDGGPANEYPEALILKATKPIQKIQQVQTTQELPDFLRTFFDLDWDRAQVLARLLGYSVELKPETELERYQEDMDWYENYYKSELASYSILKALRDASDYSTVFSELNQEEKDTLNKDVLNITKTLKNVEEIKKVFSKPASLADKTASGNRALNAVKPAGETPVLEANSTTEKSLMSDQKDEKISEEIQKQLSDKDAALAEALALIEKLSTEKAAKIIAEKTAAIKAATADDASAALFLKAALTLEDAEFSAYVKALEANKAAVEKSQMFTEVGASGAPETPADKTGIQKSVSGYLAAKYKKDSK